MPYTHLLRGVCLCCESERQFGWLLFWAGRLLAVICALYNACYLSTFQCNVSFRISYRYIFCVVTHFLSMRPVQYLQDGEAPKKWDYTSPRRLLYKQVIKSNLTLYSSAIHILFKAPPSSILVAAIISVNLQILYR